MSQRTKAPAIAYAQMVVLAVVLFKGLTAVLGWVGTYLVPVVVIFGVVVVSFWPLVWVAGKLDDRWYTLP
jgi:hypothetical protein